MHDSSLCNRKLKNLKLRTLRFKIDTIDNTLSFVGTTSTTSKEIHRRRNRDPVRRLVSL